MLRPLAYDEKYVIVYSCQALITLISYLSTNTSQVTHSMPRLDAKIGCQAAGCVPSGLLYAKQIIVRMPRNWFYVSSS